MEILCVHLRVEPVRERILHSRTRECIHGLDELCTGRAYTLVNTLRGRPRISMHDL